jgi:hypothetical protein
MDRHVRTFAQADDVARPIGRTYGWVPRIHDTLIVATFPRSIGTT